MSDDQERHPVDLLAEEYAEMLRRGNAPSIEEFIANHAEHAELLRIILPSIELVERVSQQEIPGSKSSTAIPDSSSVKATLDGKMLAPQTLGDFRIVREIGRGGMGVVYEALQQSLKRHVALKVVSSIAAGSRKQRERFRREAEAAAALHHTNIVPVYGIGEDHGLQYYAMQLIDGVTLGDVVDYLLQGPEDADPLHASELKHAWTRTGGEANRKFSPQSNSQSNPESKKDSSTNSSDSEADRSDYSLGDQTISASRLSFGAEQAVRLLLNDSELLRNVPSVSKGASTAVDVPVASTEVVTQLDQKKAPSFVNQVPQAGATVSILGNRGKSRNFGVEYYRKVAKLVAHVADALEYAHHQGILHRDIKPANLILDREGTVWITDFGLARKDNLEVMTQTGEIVGTLRYMAPEQLVGKADARTDIYSLGLTLYELMTLQPAIDQPKSRLLDPARATSIIPPRSLVPEIPFDLQTIALKACSHDPAHRYQTAREFEEDLLRFLDDRPILARRTTRIEKLQRWARRNPMIAALSSATVFLLLFLAAVLLIWNRQQQRAINRIGDEYARAESNLIAKTEALESAERERLRAENNLKLAIEAFEAVVNNIAARGGLDLEFEDIGEEGEAFAQADATLSGADVRLLETLLVFFDKFSAENETDLSEESASARRRVADIQHRLGRLDDAERSYRLALEAYRKIAKRDPQSPQWIVTQSDILNEMLVLCVKRGQIPRAMSFHQETRELLKRQPKIAESPEGRFALARSLNTLASFGSKFNREVPLRTRNFFGNRLPPPPEGIVPPMQNARLRRETQANEEALDLLKDLTDEFPSNVSYQVAYAKALRDQVRIARMLRDLEGADKALQKSIDILQKLVRENSESTSLKFALAETLSTSVGARNSDIQRLVDALQIISELVKGQPDRPEYLALEASTLVRMAALQASIGRKDRAEENLTKAIDTQTKLMNQFSDVVIYRLTVVQSHQQMVDLMQDRNQPDRAISHLDQAIQIVRQYGGSAKEKNLLQSFLTRMVERKKSIENAVRQKEAN